MNGNENPAFIGDPASNGQNKDFLTAHEAEAGLELRPVNGKGGPEDLDTPRKDDDPTEDEVPPDGGSWLGRGLMRVLDGVAAVQAKHRLAIHRSVIVVMHALVLAYVITASMHFYVHMEGTYEDGMIFFCDGLGMVYLLVGIVYLCLFYFQIIKPIFGRRIYKAVLKPIGTTFDRLWAKTVFRVVTYLVILGALVTFLVIDTATERARLISCGGVVVLILLGFIFSKHPAQVRWRPVFWGLGLQFVFALLSIRWPLGRAVLECVGNKVSTFLAYTDTGTSMVYGDYLITTLGVFAFKVLPVIFFFSFFVQILYYYGAMQWVVLKLGWLLQVTLGTTVCESVNTAASIFLGQSEAPLLIKPYIPLLTRSELHAIMTGGFATIAGAVMAAYMSFGVSPSHLITASVMSAPAALCYAKLFWPETEKSKTTVADIVITKGEESSALDAATKGANDGIVLVQGIVANLIAFIAFMSFLNGAISWFGSQVGAEYLTFEWLLGKAFIPLAFVMGVEWADCEQVGRLVGLKTLVNEFVAYQELGELIAAGTLAPRSHTIATYALCGFANPGSIGIMIASLSAMAPHRRSNITEVAFRAFIAGSAACFLTACVAGALIDSSTIIIPPLPTNSTLM